MLKQVQEYSQQDNNMTTKRIHSIEKYVGLSTDIKPQDAVIGSEFWERDTDCIYVCYDKIAGVALWSLKN